MREIRTVVMLLGLTSWAVSSHGAVDLPFSDGFENQTNGMVLSSTSPWGYSQAAVATNSPSPKDGSILSTYAPDGMWLEIKQTSDLGPYSNVWYHCYAKVRAHTNGAVVEVGAEAAAFYVAEPGHVVARSNENWVVFSNVFSSVNDWIGFSVQLDFKSETWNLYTTTNSYTHGTPLKKINGAPMAFNSDYVTPAEIDKELAKVEITGETYLDSVVITKTKQAVVPAVDSPEQVITSASVELKLNDIYTGVFLKYFEVAERKLTGAFGDALKGTLVAGDQVLFFLPGTGWQTYTRQGPDAAWSYSAPTVDPATFTITPAMAMYIRFFDDNPRESAFVTAFNGVQSVSGTETIYGSDDANVAGWNLLSFPDKGANLTLAELGLPGVTAGDRIYVRQGTGWYYARFIGGQWISGGVLATATFPAGTVFWYRRGATSSPGWDY